MATDPGPRISRLRTLIDHPRTGDDERAVAQRMLRRILSKSARPDPYSGRVYGKRYDLAGRHASLARVAEMIRADIALATVRYSTPDRPGTLGPTDPLGNAPAEITYTVESPHDGSIVVTIDGIPEEWGWVQENGFETVSPALRAVADDLADIMDSYNRDGADIDKRFFGRVCARGETLVW
ncbi:hypothetical protein [Nocardia sp. NPDC057440]|uniref:hypothetical protein n=1 Tax=Nocardia sp. NPDC057440 TaxID=3346134 RepID=UPI003672BC15